MFHKYYEAVVGAVDPSAAPADGLDQQRRTDLFGELASIGSDLAYAWPSAELAVMGASGAVEILNRAEIAAADDKVAKKAELVDVYAEKWLNPYIAAERGYVDDVIDPADTRRKLVAGLALLRTKREELPPRKHGNMPL